MYPAEKELDPHYSALSTRSNRPPLLRLLDTRGNRDSMKLRLESRKSLCIQQKKKWAPITLGPGCARTRMSALWTPKTQISGAFDDAQDVFGPRERRPRAHT